VSIVIAVDYHSAVCLVSYQSKMSHGGCTNKWLKLLLRDHEELRSLFSCTHENK